MYIEIGRNVWISFVIVHNMVQYCRLKVQATRGTKNQAQNVRFTQAYQLNGWNDGIHNDLLDSN